MDLSWIHGPWLFKLPHIQGQLHRSPSSFLAAVRSKASPSDTTWQAKADEAPGILDAWKSRSFIQKIIQNSERLLFSITYYYSITV